MSSQSLLLSPFSDTIYIWAGRWYRETNRKWALIILDWSRRVLTIRSVHRKAVRKDLLFGMSEERNKVSSFFGENNKLL